jgi:hypothetical protein
MIYSLTVGSSRILRMSLMSQGLLASRPVCPDSRRLAATLKPSRSGHLRTYREADVAVSALSTAGENNIEFQHAMRETLLGREICSDQHVWVESRPQHPIAGVERLAGKIHLGDKSFEFA